MSDRDDLARLIFNERQDETGNTEAYLLADAIVAAGWVSAEQHQEALDAMALQVTYTEEGTYSVLRRFRDARHSSRSLAATVQRVRDLCDHAEGEYWEKGTGAAVVLLDELRAALAPSDQATDTGGEGRG